MGTAFGIKNAKKSDVCGIRHFTDVVIGVVAGMPAHGLRLLETARSLLARLTWRVGAGPMAVQGYRLTVAGPAAGWVPEPSSSGATPRCFNKRQGRPGSALGVGRF